MELSPFLALNLSRDILGWALQVYTSPWTSITLGSFHTAKHFSLVSCKGWRQRAPSICKGPVQCFLGRLILGLQTRTRAAWWTSQHLRDGWPVACRAAGGVLSQSLSSPLVVRGNKSKKDFPKSLSSKEKTRENMEPLLNEASCLVTQHMEKIECLSLYERGWLWEIPLIPFITTDKSRQSNHTGLPHHLLFLTYPSCSVSSHPWQHSNVSVTPILS